MKKRIAACALSAFAFATPAEAEGWNPYVGGGFQGSYNSYDKYDDVAPSALWGAEVHAGVTPHKHFGAEFSYSGQYGQDTAVSVWMHTIGVDGLAYAMPLKGSKHFKLIGTGGLIGSYYSGKRDLSTLGGGTATVNGVEFGVRGGGGFQFGMTENTNVRTLIRYQQHFGDTIGGGLLYSVGVNYEF